MVSVYGHALGRPWAHDNIYTVTRILIPTVAALSSFVLSPSDCSIAVHRHTKMQTLPDELLRMIAGQVLKMEDGLRMWCRLSTTCKRLWSLQLPSEPLYVLDSNRTARGDIICLS